MTSVQIFFVFLLVCLSAQADPGFTNLSPADFENISKEFSHNFGHRSVTGAKPYGSIFGFELSLVAGQTPTPETDRIVKNSVSGASLGNLYHAGFLAGASAPFGLTGELLVTPKLSGSGSDFSQSSLALKWTFTEVLSIPFINMALRGAVTNSKLSFQQSSGGVVGTVENKNDQTSVHLLVSPALFIVEPYAGIGVVNAKNSLGVSGTGTVFNSAVTTGQSAEVSKSSSEILVGINARLLLISLGAEYAQSFGASSITGKLGFTF